MTANSSQKDGEGHDNLLELAHNQLSAKTQSSKTASQIHTARSIRASQMVPIKSSPPSLIPPVKSRDELLVRSFDGNDSGGVTPVTRVSPVTVAAQH